LPEVEEGFSMILPTSILVDDIGVIINLDNSLVPSCLSRFRQSEQRAASLPSTISCLCNPEEKKQEMERWYAYTIHQIDKYEINKPKVQKCRPN